MFFTSIATISTLGIASIFIHTSHNESKKKYLPGNNLRLGLNKGRNQKLGDALSNIETIPRSHSQQLLDISEDDLEISDAEKEINHKIKLFVGSFGLATLSSFIYAPLNILSLPTALYILKDVYKAGLTSLFKEKKLTVEILAALLVTIFIAKGSFLMYNLHLMLYLFNRKLLYKMKHHSSNNIVDVFKQRPRRVWLLSNGIETEVPFESLTGGDIVVVNAGETIPVDGTIMAGTATVDQQLLTGESQPVERGVDESVFALTVLLAGRIEIQVDKTGEETTAAQIGHILNQTVDAKTDMQLWTQRIANRTVLPTILLAALAWPLLGPASALIVLNSHFRHRLTIITSTSILNFLNLAAQKGILIKDGRTLELLNQIDTIVFDKTGTLTLEQPHIRQIHTYADYDEDDVLRYGAAAEYKQTHPIAKAILDAADQKNLALPTIEQAECRVGYGVMVSIDGHVVRIGSSRFMTMENCALGVQMIQTEEQCHAQGHSLVMVALDEQVIGAIELQATIRPEAKAIISQLRQQLSASIYIISGDQETPTRKLAEELEIDHYFAETLPENKAELIGRLQEEGRAVCYIGDGINDAIALKSAEVSVSLRGASSVAIDTAQVILMDGTLNQLAALFTVAQTFERNMDLICKGVVAPSCINLAGALFPQFTLIHSMMLSGVSAVAGFGGAMWPLVEHEKQLQSQEIPQRIGMPRYKMYNLISDNFEHPLRAIHRNK